MNLVAEAVWRIPGCSGIARARSSLLITVCALIQFGLSRTGESLSSWWSRWGECLKDKKSACCKDAGTEVQSLCLY
jgi:hypothetical protein